MRIDKLLADKKLYTRKEAKEIIRSGRVTVSGNVIKDAGFSVSPEQDDIYLDGEPLLAGEFTYLVMNKPGGVLSACRDDRHTTVLDILPEELKSKGLFPVGRLDKDTTGMLIITNDGEFSHKVTSPKSGIIKRYHATLDKPLDSNVAMQFAEGIVMEDGTEFKPAKLTVISEHEAEVEVTEGKYHQVKRMFLSAGYTVIQLHRLSIGDFSLEAKLLPSDCRKMEEDELELILSDKGAVI